MARIPRRCGPLAVVAAAVVLVGQPPGTALASARAGTERVLYSFAGANGAGPLSGVISGPGGVLYGTTVFGGRYGTGCVFALTPSGGGYTERVLFSFHGAAGSQPGGNVVAGAHGDLFGETIVGGAAGNGTVFELVPGQHGYAEHVLHSFAGGADGSQPIGAPVLGAHGELYGVTQFGGTGNRGVIYAEVPSATGYTEHVLHSFASGHGQPQAGLAMAAGGTLYGTLYGADAFSQDGSVFSFKPSGTAPGYTDLHDFRGGSDGSSPFAALTVDNRTGVIYGSTQFGGADNTGTIFSLTPSGTGYTERVRHAFTLGKGGYAPEAPLLIGAGGVLFGTTNIGGVGCSGTGCSTIFALTPAGAGYGFRVLHRFTGPPDGAEAEWSGLIPGPGGHLFGTTRSGGTAHACSDGGPGGASGCGTVYTITP
jgi:uncharacterized repeat protein (TIGR03803 family)